MPYVADLRPPGTPLGLKISGRGSGVTKVPVPITHAQFKLAILTDVKRLWQAGGPGAFGGPAEADSFAAGCVHVRMWSISWRDG
ncbi:hypothetical protein GCM10010361_50720 [Streptomyces olivaceiscleroticus]|uniref:Uncharacterized protein n=1 Tax=Streptomyces olivaceiscleroticus TaxID=68245 RepID=A0ABP3KH09_9ACTN